MKDCHRWIEISAQQVDLPDDDSQRGSSPGRRTDRSVFGAHAVWRGDQRAKIDLTTEHHCDELMFLEVSDTTWNRYGVSLKSNFSMST